MIKLVYGPKGTGKTKQLIDVANANLQSAKGLSVFITDTKRYMYDLKRDIRFVDVKDWNITGEEALCGFVKGIAAGNGDNEFIYIDGIARIAGNELKDLASIFFMLDKVSAENGITVVITCSAAKEELHDFVAKYA